MARSAEKIIATVRANATDVKILTEVHFERHYIESGRIASTIAGAKIHSCKYTIYRLADKVTGELGPEELAIYPSCGTSRAAGQGGYYQNYYGIKPAGTDADCGKCVRSLAKAAAK
jgi:hypothetical protein